MVNSYTTYEQGQLGAAKGLFKTKDVGRLFIMDILLIMVSVNSENKSIPSFALKEKPVPQQSIIHPMWNISKKCYSYKVLKNLMEYFCSQNLLRP